MTDETVCQLYFDNCLETVLTDLIQTEFRIQRLTGYIATTRVKKLFFSGIPLISYNEPGLIKTRKFKFADPRGAILLYHECKDRLYHLETRIHEEEKEEDPVVKSATLTRLNKWGELTQQLGQPKVQLYARQLYIPLERFTPTRGTISIKGIDQLMKKILKELQRI